MVHSILHYQPRSYIVQQHRTTRARGVRGVPAINTMHILWLLFLLCGTQHVVLARSGIRTGSYIVVDTVVRPRT